MNNTDPVLGLRAPTARQPLARRVLTGFLAAGLTAAALHAFPSAAVEKQVLRGHVPAAALQQQATGRLPADQTLNLAIGLPLRDQAELTQLIQDLYNPANPQFHQYLTPEQFTQRFGPSSADYDALIAWAQANGLTVTRPHPNRVLLSVSGPVSAIEQALHVRMQVFQHPTENRTFFAPDAEPSLDLNTPLLHISGLDNYILPHSMLRPRGTGNTNITVKPMVGSGPQGTYIGDDFRTAYVPGSLLTGAGQVVGLFQFDGYYAADIQAYEQLTGRPNVPLENVLIGGANGLPNGSGGDVEVSLDIQMVIAIAPGVSKIMVYIAPRSAAPEEILNRMATDNAAKQLSASWTWGGGSRLVVDQIFQQMIVQGQSFFHSTGDSDALVPGQVDDQNQTFAPSDSPYITQVGGTTLTTDANGAYVSETVWNSGGGGTNGAPSGSSGGISSFYSIPVWQSGVNMTTNKGSLTSRTFPDVAFTGDNVWTVWGNGASSSPSSGTSVAAPLWAGFMALINQKAVSAGNPPVGFINPAVYSIGLSAAYSSAFHDVTNGDNTWSGSPNLFPAVSGYDLATGWGTPNGTNLINLLAAGNGAILAVQTNYIFGGNGNGVVDNNECNDLFLVITNPGTIGATNATLTLSTTDPGVFIPQATSPLPDIVGGTSVTNLTALKLSTTPEFVCGTPINLIATIKYAAGAFSSPVQIQTGTNGPPQRFDNFFPVAIPDGDPTGTNSSVLVSNIVGTIEKVTVSLYMVHRFDVDMTLQLIGPDGTTVTLSQQHGGPAQNYGLGCFPDNYRTTFDDSATNPIANGIAPFVGTFKPDQPLSVFAGKSGTNANGIWSLHLIDNIQFGLGTNECWSLFISSAACSDGGGQCPGLDLGIAMVDSPDPAVVGSNLTYTITVTNAGPGIAHGTVVSQNLPGTVQFVSAVPSQGSASYAGGVVTCTLGNLGVGATATITVTVTPLAAGTIFSTATVASNDPELNPLNNIVTTSTIVTPPVADLAVGIVGAPNPTLVGGSLVYTISVTNNGPAAASGVAVTNTLPPTVRVNSVDWSQGSVSVFGNTAIFNAGLLTRNSYATATINVTPLQFGAITATAHAVAVQPDPALANNTASVVTTVGQSADLSVNLSANPNPVVINSNLTYSILVTNLGPNDATNVVMTQNLPGGVTVISNYVSQGTIATNGSTLVCHLGTIIRNARATVLVYVTTTRLGSLTSTATVTAPQTDPNPNNNSSSATATVSSPFVNIVPVSASLTVDPNGNGAIDNNETVTVAFRLQNIGNVVNTNLVATLQASGGVSPITTSQNYSLLRPIGVPGGVPVSRSFQFTASGVDGGTIAATLHLHDAGGYDTNVVFTFQLPSTATFANTNFITIPDFGGSMPYANPLQVTGMTGQIGKVTASLLGLSHTYVHDVNALLVGPTGVKVLLMSHAADQSSVDNANVTFDQTAASQLPAIGEITSGSWQPSDYPPSVSFTNPAPATPYASTLANFNGINPNGAWTLYLLDDSPGDSGFVANGWTLGLTTVAPVNQLADIGLTAIPSTNVVAIGDSLVYTYVISNAGPATASGITFSNALPPTVSLLSYSNSAGNLAVNGNIIIGNLGSMGVGATAVIAITVTPTSAALATGSVAGTLTNTAYVSAFETDLHSGDNSTTTLTALGAQQADLALAFSAIPPTVIGSNLTYTITVTNSGPGSGINLTVTNPIPPGVSYVSSQASGGISALVNGNVVANFSTLAPGATATLNVTVQATALGTNVVNASVSGAQPDPALSNNSATAFLPVVPPSVSVIISAVSLSAESFQPANGVVDAGETVTAQFSLLNVGTIPVSNLGATFLNSGGLTRSTASSSNFYGTLLPGGPAVTRSFTFTNNGTGGAVATLQLQAPGFSGPASFTFSTPNLIVYPNPINIPDHGIATPYPSTTNISGLTGYVGKVTVTLNGLSHSFPSDVSVLLVNPAGHATLLMSHAGSGYSLTNQTIAFDDAAPTVLPGTSPIVSGTYRPGAYSPNVVFPAPAPSVRGSTLANLNGVDPNGVWALYVLDDSAGDAGSLAGWSLNITTINALYPVADLAIGMSTAPASDFQGNNIVFNLRVTNLGPASASGVLISDTLPPGFSFRSGSASQGSSPTAAGGLVTFNLGSLDVGAYATASLVAASANTGTFVNTASVSGAVTDFLAGNNTAQNVITVLAAPRLTATVSGGLFFLTVSSAQPGSNYVVQASADFSSWISLKTNTAAGDGTFTYSDPNTHSFSARYYRVQRR
jgi:uncharacterized repeat protein (TIGR01451 family)